MTYRERRQAKAERLRGWADGREAKSAAAYEGAKQVGDMIPFGQPILVGHHSEGRHRRDIDRIDSGMRAAVEHSDKADSMRSRADEIERQADKAIYRDDPDEVERLEEKLAGLETKREEWKAANAAYRREHRAELKGMSAYGRSQLVPYPSYSLQNLGGTITNTRKRLDEAKRRRAALDGEGSRGFARVMTSRYGGTCPDCGKTFEKGDPIHWFRLTKEALCDECGQKEGQR